MGDTSGAEGSAGSQSPASHTDTGRTGTGITRWVEDQLEYLDQPGYRSECVVGWRVWRVVNDPFIPLQSTFMSSMWRPGQPMGACCSAKQLRHGIHAYDMRERAEEYWRSETQAYFRSTPFVFGEVNLWGRVVIHENGYRAQFAYPKRILVPVKYRGRDLVNMLRRAYGIDVEWVDVSQA